MKTFEQLIEEGVLVRSNESEILARDGFISYVLADDYVVRINLDEYTSYTLTYLQQVLTGHGSIMWVAQLEGRSDDPINASLNIDIDMDVFKKI